MTFETLDFDLRETLESALELLAERAASKKIELAWLVQIRRRRCSCAAIPDRLRQILNNLVGNADQVHR